MTFQPPRSGLNNTAEYMASGLPWVTASAVGPTPIKINFPHVTNWIHVKQTAGGPLRFGWTTNGINAAGGTANYGLLATSASFEASLRMHSLFLRSDTDVSSSFEIVAGLTMILHDHFPTLTGSAVYPSGSTARWEYGYGTCGSTASGSGLG